METITIKTEITASLEKVWERWTSPEHITKWNFASPEWHCPRASNDLRKGGSFTYRMEAKDGSAGFDFWGTYSLVKQFEKIEYKIANGRKVKVTFAKNGDKVIVSEIFEIESQNSAEIQRTGWQSILDNFRKYAEKASKPFTNVDEYIALQPKMVKPLLEKLRNAIKKAAPEAEEILSYGMPAYRYHGILVYFAGNKKHIGFYPTGSGIEAFKEEFGEYKHSKGAVQFPLDKPLPLGLVKKIVKFRVIENLDNLDARKKKR